MMWNRVNISARRMIDLEDWFIGLAGDLEVPGNSRIKI